MGLAIGALLGALGGTMDRGSMMLLMPSGPPFWAIIGAFGGGIVGALYGAIARIAPQSDTTTKPKTSDTAEKDSL